jgi:ABC-2 type transport system ATP-binding protein
MNAAISLSNITKEYPGVLALKDISFKVSKGSVHGFLGPNGAGKSTTMKIITGLLNATSGEVDLMPDAQIGFLSEIPPLYENMTVSDYLTYVQKIFNLNDKNYNYVNEALIQCGLDEVKSRLIGNLSKGYKQRVGIAQTLVQKANIIILDEPTVGLDPHSIAEIRNLIRSLGETHTVMISSHQLHELSLICNEITIINKGEVLKSGPVEEIRETLQEQQVIEVEINIVSDDVITALEKFGQVEKVKSEDKYRLKISANSTEDIRPYLSKIFLENNCVLFSMTEKKLNLEDIFKEVTKKG